MKSARISTSIKGRQLYQIFEYDVYRPKVFPFIDKNPWYKRNGTVVFTIDSIIKKVMLDSN